MLRRFKVDKFKCIESMELPELRNLTILTGANNIGKSSLIHALIFLRNQVISGNSRWDWPALELRSHGETVFQNNPKNNVRIECWFDLEKDEKDYLPFKDVNEIGYRVVYGEGGQIIQESVDMDHTNIVNVYMKYPGKHVSIFYGVKRITFEHNFAPLGWNISDINLHTPVGRCFALKTILDKRFRNIHYISPFRKIGDWSSSPGGHRRTVGSQGEETHTTLHNIYSDRDVNFDRIEDWLKKFDDEIELLKTPMMGSNVATVLKTPYGEINVKMSGSGLKSILPVVIECLISEPDSIVIIEEPEIHLHRGAQKVLVDLFLDLVKEGKQIIFTTHSWDIHVELKKMMKFGQITDENISRYDLRFEGKNRIVKKTAIFDEIHKKWHKELKETLG